MSTSFSVLGIGLSFAFGCMLLGLVAELYYLLWWKKRISSRITEDRYSSSQSDIVVGKEPSHLFCRRSLSRFIESSSDVASDDQRSTEVIVERELDLEMGRGGGAMRKGIVEEGAECEIMRMYNMCGPPRFLFTIKEETKDELVESDHEDDDDDDNDDDDDDDDRKSRTRSMSDAPFLSPLGSPVMKTPHNHGYNLNPLFEQFTEVEEEIMNRVRCSPPPKFKFLRDAEEKLMRKLMEEAQAKGPQK